MSPPAINGSRQRLRGLQISLVLFSLTFAVFSRSLFDDFVAFDDDQSVYRNPHIQGLNWDRLCWMFTDTTHTVRYKPLTWLTYGLTYQVFGLNPFGYHLVSLLFHCLNAALVFAVLRRLLAQALPLGENQALGAKLDLSAALGALLWAVNPLRVEPVARVTDLTYGQSLFFLLISLWFYLPMSPGESASRRRSYWCSTGAFAFSMLSYPFAFGYALVLAGLDYYPLRRVDWFSPWWRQAATRRIAFEKVPFLLLGGLVFATWLARLSPAGDWTGLPSATSLNPTKQAIQALYVWAYYVWKPWLPFHLSPIYNTLVWFNPRTWPFWSSAAVVAAISWLVWRQRRHWPWAIVLWVAHLTLLVPALGLTERVHHACDRYAYIPGIVWAVIIAALLWKCAKPQPSQALAIAAAVTLAIFWSGLTFHQLRIWRNSESLFNYMLGQLDDRPLYRGILHGYLGTFYADHGRVREAIGEYQTSLRIEPSVAGYYQLASLLETNGAPDAALTNYLKMLELSPNPNVEVKAAVLLSERSRNREATELYRQALQSVPNWPLALNNLAWILATAPEPELRDGAQAVQLAERACALTQSQVPVMLGTLAAAYAETGRFAEAIETGERACALAQAAGDLELAERNRELVKLYRTGRAQRETRAPGS